MNINPRSRAWFYDIIDMHLKGAEMALGSIESLDKFDDLPGFVREIVTSAFFYAGNRDADQMFATSKTAVATYRSERALLTSCNEHSLLRTVLLNALETALPQE